MLVFIFVLLIFYWCSVWVIAIWPRLHRTALLHFESWRWYIPYHKIHNSIAYTVILYIHQLLVISHLLERLSPRSFSYWKYPLKHTNKVCSFLLVLNTYSKCTVQSRIDILSGLFTGTQTRRLVSSVFQQYYLTRRLQSALDLTFFKGENSFTGIVTYKFNKVCDECSES